MPWGAVGCHGVPWGAMGCRGVPWGAVGCLVVPHSDYKIRKLNPIALRKAKIALHAILAFLSAKGLKELETVSMQC